MKRGQPCQPATSTSDPAEDERLRNPFWHALLTEQAAIALGSGAARRFPPDCIPFAGLATWDHSSFTALHALLAPGESIFVTREESTRPPPPIVFAESIACLQMIYAPRHSPEEPRLEPAALQPALLGPPDVPEMMALKQLAFPGYYGPRAPSLGTYYGIRVAGQLVAMAGERLALPSMREVSAVCTHPAHLGQGYAARLIRKLVADQLASALTPFLHVIATNQRAIALYERLGFVPTRMLIFERLERS
ncbi:MAG TPA: GNAT family N-acetyltransferase [Acidobacteriaceae bacterium]